MVTLPADGWPAGPRNGDFRGITWPQGRSSLITGKSGLCQEHLTREMKATVGMFPEAESRVWSQEESLQLAGIRELSQRNQQSRKCLVSGQGARTQGQGGSWRGGQDGKPNRRWGWARTQSVRDTSEGGQQGAGRATGLTVHGAGAWASGPHGIWLHPSSSLKGLRHCLGHIQVVPSMTLHICQGWSVTLRLPVITRTKHNGGSAI